MNLTTGYPYWLINSGLPANYPILKDRYCYHRRRHFWGINIGTYDKTPHTYYALGFGGNGITFSVIAAEIIRDMILEKNNKDASLFAFDR